MIRRTRSSSGSPTPARSMRSSPASSPNRSGASGEYGASPRVGERVAERGDLGRVDPVGDLEQVVGDRPRVRATGLPAGELLRAAAEQRAGRADRSPSADPVSSVSSAALAVTSCRRLRVATTSATSGSRSRPGQADDLDRDPSTGQRVEDLCGVGVVAGENADLRPRGSPSGVVDRRRPASRAPRRRCSNTRAPTSPGTASPGATRGSTCGELVVERGGQAVGDLEDPGVGAAVDGQGPDRDRPAARPGTSRAKPRMLDTEAPRQP